ncbi:Peroxiredoxin bcp1 [Cladobotryum mycophilum]|uniref:thioredoxin-dependent peroxiredoxin n=1 Tax=Cladobotryum mycophilum TaxID=491253 RepID=A0ABR0SKR0_9HYPO
MPVELRKRKAPVAPPVPAPVPKKKAASRSKKAAAPEKPKDEVKKPEPEPKKSAKEEAKEASPETTTEEKVEEKEKPKEDKKAASGKVAVGDTITLEDFGGEIQTNDGEKTTLQQLVEESESGVVLFTYPKASTPGCTNQACLFRDSYEPLTADGLAIYGLSTDSPKANTTFKEKQKLPYPLLCDPQATLIAAIGLKKQPKGTQRGVFVVDKEGKVLVAEPGGPAATVDRVKALVEELKENK